MKTHKICPRTRRFQIYYYSTDIFFFWTGEAWRWQRIQKLGVQSSKTVKFGTKSDKFHLSFGCKYHAKKTIPLKNVVYTQECVTQLYLRVSLNKSKIISIVIAVILFFIHFSSKCSMVYRGIKPLFFFHLSVFRFIKTIDLCDLLQLQPIHM